MGQGRNVSARIASTVAHDSCVDRAFPAWSPDGKRIAFGQGQLENGKIKFAEIFLMNANGTGVGQVTRVTAASPFAVDVLRPAWSPNGKQLVFEVEHLAAADPPNRHALFIVNTDGTELRQLTDWGFNAGDDPDWSPDGRLILFRTIGRPKRLHGNLYTIHPDGSALMQLTRYPAPKNGLQRLILARRQMDHIFAIHRRAVPGHLHHARRRNGSPPRHSRVCSVRA